MSTVSKLRAAVPVPIRNIMFNRDKANQPRWWHSNDPVPTAFFNAMSCLFPEGEKFFMDSVRYYRDVATPELKTQIRGFIGQEAVHSREHAAFNALAEEAGYDVAKLENRAKTLLGFAKTRSKTDQLAATVALEHFTAILAHVLLKEKGMDLKGAPRDIERLWNWHAMEEIEHKAVAFDTFMMVTRSWSPLHRYFKRTQAMVIATSLLVYAVGANMASLYKEDGINNPKTWARTLYYLTVKPGAIRRIALIYLDYYRPGFHPWDHDDRQMLAETEQAYDLAVAA